MIVSDIQTESTAEGFELSGIVTFESVPDFRRKVWFRSEPGCPKLELSGDPFFAGFVVPAMSLRENLRIEAPVTPELIETATSTIQSILLRWNPDFRAPEIETDGSFHRPNQGNVGVLCTFSGGLDSWYTFLKNREEITHLLHCSGFDRPEASTSRTYERHIRDLTRTQAKRSGKIYLGLSTNLTDIGSIQVMAGRFKTGRKVDPLFQKTSYFTSQLLAFALCYGPLFHKLYIPNSFPYERIWNTASNPLTDPAWSIPQLQVVHDGAEADRTEKAELLLRLDSEALKVLHVCHSQGSRGENCNRCEKCLRTRVSLELIGFLDQCPALRNPVTPEEIQLMDVSEDPSWWEHLLEHARGQKKESLARAIEVALGGRWHPKRFRQDLQTWARLSKTPWGRKQIRDRSRGAYRERRRRFLNSI